MSKTFGFKHGIFQVQFSDLFGSQLSHGMIKEIYGEEKLHDSQICSSISNDRNTSAPLSTRTMTFVQFLKIRFNMMTSAADYRL